MNLLRRLALLACVLLPCVSHAFNLSYGELWDVAELPMVVGLGSSSAYSGSPQPGQVAREAILAWNGYMDRTQFTVTTASTPGGTYGNAVNEVYWGSGYWGEAFPDGVLAVTLTKTQSYKPVECDIVVNTGVAWATFSGLQSNRWDLRRVVMHEAGHVLGLDHPDALGQDVSALMNSIYGAIEMPTIDDQAGLMGPYGPGPLTSAPIITRHPAPVEKTEGDYAEFSVECQLGTKFQWFKDDVAIPGATNKSFIVGSLTFSKAGNYTVEVSNARRSTRSEAATLTVLPGLPPVLTRDLADRTVEEASSVSLYVQARSITDLQYDWFKDGVAMAGYGNGFSTLDFTGTEATAGQYQVRVSNAFGFVWSSKVTLTVNPPPLPTRTRTATQYLTVAYGSSPTLDARITGVSLKWQWLKDGVPVVRGEQSASSLNFYSARPSDSGVYRCVARNRSGEVTSRDIVLEVLSPAISPVQLQCPTPELLVGETASLSLTGLNQDAATVFWYKDGELLGQGNGKSIYSAKLSDEGTYHAVAVFATGSVTTNRIRIRVRPAREHYWTAVHAGIFYSFAADRRSVERRRISDLSVLPPILLPGPGRVIAVSDRGVFVGRDTPGDYGLYRCELDQTQAQAYGAFHGQAVQFIFTAADSFYTLDYGGGSATFFELLNYAYPDGARGASRFIINGVITTQAFMDAETGLVHGIGNVYGSSPARYGVQSIPLVGPGNWSTVECADWMGRSWFQSGRPGLWLTSGGGVYDQNAKVLTGRIAQQVDYAAPLEGGETLVLSAGLLLRLDEQWRTLAWAPAPKGATVLAQAGGKWLVTGVGSDGNRFFATVDVAAMTPGEPASAETGTYQGDSLPMEADCAFIDRDGLLNRVELVGGWLTVWSPVERKRVRALRLRGSVKSAQYNPATNTLFLAYDDQVITCLTPGPAAAEQILAKPLAGVQALVCAGDKLLVQRPSTGSWEMLDASSGKLLGVRQTSYRDTWDRALWLESSKTWTLLSWSGDSIYAKSLPLPEVSSFEGSGFPQNTTVTSPSADERGAGVPLALLDPTGDRLVLGNGYVVSATSFQRQALLPCHVAAAAWSGGLLFTASEESGGLVLRRWSADLGTESARLVLPLLPRSLHVLPDGRLLLQARQGRVARILILDTNLGVLSEDVLCHPRRLANMSINAEVGTGDEILVPGFVTKGALPKTLLVRAVGPGLARFGVGGVLADPYTFLYNAAGGMIGFNDNWGLDEAAAIRARSKELKAFDLEEDSKDSVLLKPLASGLYTVAVRGLGATTGRAIVEVYDADAAPGDARLVNMSARCKVSSSGVAIAGFVIEGDVPRKVLIRAVGPRLADFKVSGVLPDPKLRLFQGQTVIAENDNWSASAADKVALEAAFEVTGAFALNAGSKDAALLVELAPGDYTVWMESADGGSGVGLVELYEME